MNTEVERNGRDLRFAEIPHGGQAYEETVALRDDILRRPLGLAFTPEQLAAEASDHHLACYDSDGSLLGCLILTPEGEGTVRMRQVAVDGSRQRGGVGTALVGFSERFARERGYSMMVLHARDTAVPFYDRLGYERYGEPFEEVTIPHWRMRKRIGNAE